MNIARNKKAFFDYEIKERLEVGVALVGSEVKSIKAGKVSIKEAFVRIIRDEVFVLGMSVVPWEYGSIYNPQEARDRKLLLHKKEIKSLKEKVKQDGYTIVPLSLYTKRGLIKMEIGLGRGKKNYDKRDTIAKRDQKRELERILKYK